MKSYIKTNFTPLVVGMLLGLYLSFVTYKVFDLIVTLRLIDEQEQTK